MQIDVSEIRKKAQETLGAAQQSKRERLSTIDERLDAEEYAEALQLNPDLAFIEIGATEFRALLGQLPNDCEDPTCMTCCSAAAKKKIGQAKSVTLYARDLIRVCDQVQHNHKTPAGKQQADAKADPQKQ